MSHHPPRLALALLVAWAGACADDARNPGTGAAGDTGMSLAPTAMQPNAGGAGAGASGAPDAGSPLSAAGAGGASPAGMGSAGGAGAAAAGAGGASDARAGAPSPQPGGAGGSSAMPDPADAGASPADAGPPALGPDCDDDPLASKEPFARGFYREFVGLFGCTAPADLGLYRAMLPMKFEMPANPEVCFYINDFKISGVGPYHEAAILLPITYAGETGKYVLSMALDNQAATSGGRAVGFPKYIGEVSLTQQGHNWVGTAANQAQVDLRATYTGECRAEDVFPWPDFINLTPIPSGTPSNEAFLSPRTGSAVMVPAEYLTAPSYHSLKGSIQLEIADDLPWNGLVDETKAFAGHLVSFKGGIDLGNQRLD